MSGVRSANRTLVETRLLLEGAQLMDPYHVPVPASQRSPTSMDRWGVAL